jgi:4-hydroxy-tetrahydrodipicolinate reductase
MEAIRILLAGATGKVGRELAAGLLADREFQLVAGIVRSGGGRDLGELLGLSGARGVPSFGSAESFLAARIKADVVIDFTVAEAALSLLPPLIGAGIAPVVGTTGLGEGREKLIAHCRAQGVGGAFLPNFAVGVMLMMRWAEEGRRFFPHVEVIEYHHHTKLDAPSGTALRTQERLQRATGDLAAPPVPVHSIRLPGLVAHQEVLFGGPGQLLTIRHDAPSRAAYTPGVLLATKWVLRTKRIALDLEEIAYSD